MKHVALLRGINVGGKRKLPMAELRALFERAGCNGVQSYIQSGNVVYEANAALAKKVPALMSALIDEEYGYEVPVMVRSAAQLRAAADACPLALEDEKKLYIGFLEKKPTSARVKALDPDRSPGDRVAVKGRELYVRYQVGQSKTKMTHAYLEKTLGPNTMRNWRTVQKLLELTEA